MLKDREELEIHLQERIKEVKSTRKKVFSINSYLQEYGIPIGTFEDIAKGNLQIALIEPQVLCVLTDAIFQTTNYQDIKPEAWFTEREIEESRKNARNTYKDESRVYLPIAIQDVVQVSSDSYITKIKMSYLVQLFHSQLIVYDYETQRSAKFIMRRDGVVPVPDVNLNSVKSIAENMVNETYLEDMITLNVYSDEVEALYYNEDNKTLTINDGATISILDGFHRLQGGVRAITINPELELEMILSIRSYDTPTAQKYFGQINTINVVKEERRRELLSENESDLVVKELQKKSDLKGKIASASNISEIAGQLTTFNVMSFAIDNVFKPKSRLEAREISEYLIKFFDYLVGSFVDQFLLNPQKHKDTNINHPLMFIGYTVIAKYFQDNNIPLKEIKNYVEDMNLNDTELKELLGDTKRGINSNALRKKVLKYFNTLVSESGEKK